MTRYKLTLEYDGTPYVGWQVQENGLSIQTVIEQAARNFCQEAVDIVGSGRTDTGVHALAQVAHVDLEKATTGTQLREALNFHLKNKGIAVLAAEVANSEFHARFSATKRHYVYKIICRRPPLVLMKNRALHVNVPLDVPAMERAAQHLIGPHDFTSFRATSCQANSPEKTLDMIRFEIVNSQFSDFQELRIHVSAQSFLHNMVRILVGTLVQVGKGRWNDQDILEILQAKDRTAAGPTAPAHGLYLARVEYN